MKNETNSTSQAPIKGVSTTQFSWVEIRVHVCTARVRAVCLAAGCSVCRSWFTDHFYNVHLGRASLPVVFTTLLGIGPRASLEKTSAASFPTSTLPSASRLDPATTPTIAAFSSSNRSRRQWSVPTLAWRLSSPPNLPRSTLPPPQPLRPPPRRLSRPPPNSPPPLTTAPAALCPSCPCSTAPPSSCTRSRIYFSFAGARLLSTSSGEAAGDTGAALS